MKLKKMLSLLLIPLVLSSNSYAAYINHHYGEKTEEKFVFLEKLNKVKYKFGKVKAYLPYSKEVIVELIEVENN